MKYYIQHILELQIKESREKNPDNLDLLKQLNIEVEELKHALTEHRKGFCDSSLVLNEAIEVACLAIRIAEEGDANYPYEFYYQLPRT